MNGVTYFLIHGFYFKTKDYAAISKNRLLKEGILKNTELCTLAVMNKFYNDDLPKMYGIPTVSERLPSIEKLKLLIRSKMAHSIEDSVQYEIQSKGYCNVMNVRPIVLSRLCIFTLVEHYYS